MIYHAGSQLVLSYSNITNGKCSQLLVKLALIRNMPQYPSLVTGQLGAQYRQCALHAAARAPADTPTHCSAGNAFLMVSETR